MQLRSSCLAASMVFLFVISTGFSRAGEDSSEYNSIKRYFGSRVSDSGYIPKDKILYLYTCNGDEDVIRAGEIKYKHSSRLIDLAYNLSDTSKALDRAGYPRAIWKDVIDRYEERQLKSIAIGGSTTVDRDFDKD